MPYPTGPRHECHAAGCDRLVPPKFFACPKHWRMLPEPFRDAIWREYRAGQEDRKDPSMRYMAVQQGAVALLAKLEGRSIWNEHRAICDVFRSLCRDPKEDGGGDPFTVVMEELLYGQPTGMILGGS